jgi:hypothetical protein
VSLYQPGILGVNSNIVLEEIVSETNKQREKLGLSPVVINQSLNQAASAKASNMFSENYWSHYSPSGKDPWGFISGAGYKFAYAGENLARNFYNSDDVVKAWMNSPTHRENIVNPKYKEIGVAVVDGVLVGQKTTLVVQMFGTAYNDVSLINPLVNVGGQKVVVPVSQQQSSKTVLTLGQSEVVKRAILDPIAITKGFGVFIIFGLGALLAIELFVLKRRGVLQYARVHLAHLSLLAIAGSSLITHSGGQIL